MRLIDNKTLTLSDDLLTVLQQGSKVAIAASCFSIYAFQVLKDRLKDIDELRFIFTSPTYTTDKVHKQKREFYIPRLNRECTVFGSEFEIKLRNDIPASQDFITFSDHVWNDSEVLQSLLRKLSTASSAVCKVRYLQSLSPGLTTLN